MQRNEFSGNLHSWGGPLLAGNSFSTGGGGIYIASSAGVDIPDSQFLRAWRLTDPRHDKERILSTKDPLLKGSCAWIFEDETFTQWWANDDCRILWINGNPGKGKTMMMMALIDEIQRRLDLVPKAGVLSYFFCQNTVQELGSAVAIV